MARIRERVLIWGGAGALLLASATYLVIGGPLNPPTGPIQAGGATTQQMYDAVTGISNAIGGSPRGPAIPGNNYGAASFSLSAWAGDTSNDMANVSGPLIGMRSSLTLLSSSLPRVAALTLIRELGDDSATLFGATLVNGAFEFGTITIPAAGGNVVWTLTRTNVIGCRHYKVRRADGTQASIEEVDLFPAVIRMSQPVGPSYAWDFKLGRTG